MDIPCRRCGSSAREQPLDPVLAVGRENRNWSAVVYDLDRLALPDAANRRGERARSSRIPIRVAICDHTVPESRYEETMAAGRSARRYSTE